MTPKQKIIIACASFAVCSVIFSVALVYPVFRGVLEDYKKVLAYKREILQLEEDAKNSREFETLSKQYVKEFGQFEGLFTDSKIPIAFFRFLDETAATLGVRMEKSSGSVQQLKGDRWPSFEVRLAGKGVYPDVRAFLQKIENAPYLLEVKAFKMSETSRQGEFSLSLKVFTKPL